jgi:hypothetical protein
MAKWIVVDFDCQHGCNNDQYNPGCDESCIRIKIDAELSEKFDLFRKHMKMPCPRCGKMGEQKRGEWWYANSNNTKLSDYDGHTFIPADVQNYTAQMLEAKCAELTNKIEEHRQIISKLKGMITDIKETDYL